MINQSTIHQIIFVSSFSWVFGKSHSGVCQIHLTLDVVFETRKKYGPSYVGQIISFYCTVYVALVSSPSKLVKLIKLHDCEIIHCTLILYQCFQNKLKPNMSSIIFTRYSCCGFNLLWGHKSHVTTNLSGRQDGQVV